MVTRPRLHNQEFIEFSREKRTNEGVGCCLPFGRTCNGLGSIDHCVTISMTSEWFVESIISDIHPSLPSRCSRVRNLTSETEVEQGDECVRPSDW